MALLILFSQSVLLWMVKRGDRKLYTDNRRHADLVYDTLMDMIFNGELKPGDRLPTIPLAQKIGVSRTPVLKALKIMQNEGIVVFKSSNGAWLINPTVQEINDLYVVRANLERLALSITFDLITSPIIIELKKYIDLEQEYCETGEKKLAIKAGLDFHRILGQSCPNRYLANCIENAISTTYAYLLLYESKNTIARKLSPSAHEKLVELLLQKNKTEALNIIYENIINAFHDSYAKA